MVEYIVAIDVTRVRFPADAILFFFISSRVVAVKKLENLGIDPSASRMLSERSTI